jgi:hypothetical protein
VAYSGRVPLTGSWPVFHVPWSVLNFRRALFDLSPYQRRQGCDNQRAGQRGLAGMERVRKTLCLASELLLIGVGLYMLSLRVIDRQFFGRLAVIGLLSLLVGSYWLWTDFIRPLLRGTRAAEAGAPAPRTPGPTWRFELLLALCAALLFAMMVLLTPHHLHLRHGGQALHSKSL